MEQRYGTSLEAGPIFLTEEVSIDVAIGTGSVFSTKFMAAVVAVCDIQRALCSVMYDCTVLDGKVFQ